MPPEVATVVFAGVVVGLFVLDRDRTGRTSAALWIPVIWVSLAGSRTLSQWLGFASKVVEVEQAQEGDPLDRAVQAALIALAAMVLCGRGRQFRALLRSNALLIAFLAYGALSITWSDYPVVAFKRWTKSAGDILMVLVVLTDPGRTAAIKQFLARVGFLLVPASILLIKYYPALGQGYGGWDFKVRYSGVALDKNMLGALCLISGLACLWRLNEMYRGRAVGRDRGPLLAQGVLFAMVLWVFAKANSMTSLAAFVLAGCVIIGAGARALGQRRAVVHLLVVTVLGIAVTTLFFSIGAGLVEKMGRETTLASRTDLWDELLGMIEHPLFGTGFESFWLGRRLEHLWTLHWWRPNEAHNGYIEVLLNLGWIGVSLLALVMVTGYRTIVGALRLDPGVASLRLGYFVAGAAYALTEAAFRPLSVVWILFVLSIVAVPQAQGAAVRNATVLGPEGSRWAFSGAGSSVELAPQVSADRPGNCRRTGEVRL